MLRTPVKSAGEDDWILAMRTAERQGHVEWTDPRADDGKGFGKQELFVSSPRSVRKTGASDNEAAPAKSYVAAERDTKVYETRVLCGIVARQQEELQQLRAKLASTTGEATLTETTSRAAPRDLKAVEPRSSQGVRHATRLDPTDPGLGRRQLHFSELEDGQDRLEMARPVDHTARHEGYRTAERAALAVELSELRVALRAAEEARSAAEAQTRKEALAREQAEDQLSRVKVSLTLSEANAQSEAVRRVRDVEVQSAAEIAQLKAAMKAEQLDSQRREQLMFDQAAGEVAQAREMELIARAELRRAAEEEVQRERVAAMRAADNAANELSEMRDARNAAQAEVLALKQAYEKEKAKAQQVTRELAEVRATLQEAEKRANQEADARRREWEDAENAANQAASDLADARAAQAASQAEVRWLAEARQEEARAREALESKLLATVSEARASVKHAETMRIEECKRVETHAAQEREVAAGELRAAMEQLQQQQATIDNMLQREFEGGQAMASLRMQVAQLEALLRERDQQVRAVWRQGKAAMDAFRYAADSLKHRVARIEDSAHLGLLQQRIQGLERALQGGA
ncbi:hypothetical protein AB1Y20_007827 [Prymnesium parvum]|uniref:Centrosomal protein of 162 kDa n=1 Tax=Prymnesium parvum TaxID=97485 RepID=A0AB34IUW9_PRYPA